MHFSIIIPAYNYAQYLPRAVESALCQEGDDFEVIVIDDGSTDNTADILTHYDKRAIPRLKCLRQDNRGPAAARNRGADEARGDYLIFLDADDCLMKGALERFRGFLKDKGAVDMVIAGHRSIHPGGKVRTHRAPPLSDDRTRNFVRYIRNAIGISNGATAMSRGIFRQVRYPEHIRNSEDIPVFALTLALFACDSFPDPVLDVYKHDDSLRNDVKLVTGAGSEIVDSIFDPKLLPQQLMKFKEEFRARRHLTQFRTLYGAGRYAEARTYYHKALRDCPLLFFEGSYLRKYVRSLLP